MKCAFLIIVAIVAVVGAKKVKFSESAFFKKCTDECRLDPETTKRVNEWKFKETPEDKCFMLCGLKQTTHVNPDGSINVDEMHEQYASHGLKTPTVVEEFRDVGVDQDKIFAITLKYANNRKEFTDAYFGL